MTQRGTRDPSGGGEEPHYLTATEIERRMEEKAAEFKALWDRCKTPEEKVSFLMAAWDLTRRWGRF
jgi:hypothetical protein